MQMLVWVLARVHACQRESVHTHARAHHTPRLPLLEGATERLEPRVAGNDERAIGLMNVCGER